MEHILVTGGLGFVGINLLNHLASSNQIHIHNIDYFSLGKSYFELAIPEERRNRITDYRADVNNRETILQILQDFKIRKVFHLAAETHVDRSIEGPEIFFQSNVMGTLALVDSCRSYIEARGITDFRFVHVSTDEVFGDLKKDAPPFTELSPYLPNSPYAVSKASSDMIVRAWARTYGFPGIITNCTNNFGPYQNSEKFIPTIVLSLLKQRRIPVYGNGKNIRDWLFVKDHVAMLVDIMDRGQLHQNYCLGGQNELSNMDLISKIIIRCQQLGLVPLTSKIGDCIEFVDDRPGHDWRYAIDSKKYLSTNPKFMLTDLDRAINETVDFYAYEPKKA